jgi:hypothetical protein
MNIGQDVFLTKSHGVEYNGKSFYTLSRVEFLEDINSFFKYVL